MGASLLEIGKPNEAKAKLLEALPFSVDSIQQAKINLNLAIANINNCPDSADFYITNAKKLSQEGNDSTLKLSIWYYLSQIDEKKGNYAGSLEHYKKHTELLSSIFDEIQVANYLDVQKKYNFDRMRQANMQLTIDKQRNFILFLIATVFLIIIAFLFYRKKTRDEEIILTAKQEIYQLKEIINNPPVPKPDSDFIHFAILKRLALLENKITKKEKEKETGILKQIYSIVYGNPEGYDWKVLENEINQVYNGYADKLQAIAPQLNAEDFQICYLAKTGLKDKEIAGLLHTSLIRIQMRKNHFRNVLHLQKQVNFIKELDRIISNRTLSK